MNKDLAGILKNRLANFVDSNNESVISHLYGLVRTLEFNEKIINEGKEKVVRKKVPYPVDCIGGTVCDGMNAPKDKLDLVPTGKQRCLVYFEGGRSRTDNVSEDLNGVSSHTSSLDLICFYNPELFITQVGLQSILMAKMLDLVTGSIDVPIGFAQIFAAIESVEEGRLENDPSIFSQYSYYNVSLLTGCPYSCFRISLTLNSLVHDTDSCLPDLTINPSTALC